MKTSSLAPSMSIIAALLTNGGTWAASDTTVPTMTDPTAQFKELDTNRDGSLSMTEAKGDAKLTQDFKAADTNKDGAVSMDEYQALHIVDDSNMRNDPTK